MDECVITHLSGLGVCQTVSPVAQSTAIIRTLPAGAMIALPSSISGHWAVYHWGIVVPNSLTRFSIHRNSPVLESRHVTWPLGPMVTTYLSVTAGTVRLMPWKRLIFTG